MAAFSGHPGLFGCTVTTVSGEPLSNDGVEDAVGIVETLVALQFRAYRHGGVDGFTDVTKAHIQVFGADHFD